MTDRRTNGSESGGSASDRRDLESQLAVAEKRLEFYASFDRLIQDNIAQASQLMRDALSLRERAQGEIDAARAQAESRIVDERHRYRIDLEGVHAELVVLQLSSAALARRVAATLGAMNTADDLAVASAQPVSIQAVAPAPASGSGVSAAVASTTAEGAAVGEIEEADAAVEALANDDSADAPSDTMPVADAIEIEMAALGTGEESPEQPAADLGVPADATVDAPGDAGFSADAVDLDPDLGGSNLDGPVDAAAAAHEAAPVESSPEPEAPELAPYTHPAPEGQSVPAEQSAERSQPEPFSGPRSVTVLVHGVPRAAAALSLQRHLHGLSHVNSVEAREYAEGILRLQVTTLQQLGLSDLQSWDGGSNLEPVTVTGDIIEVKLPGA